MKPKRTYEKKTNREVVEALLARWEQWQNLYPSDYVDRFFHLYDDELRPVIKFLKRHV